MPTEASENIVIQDGSKRITVNSDPERVIVWYPNDPNLLDRIKEFQVYAATLPEKIKAIKGLDKVELDDSGYPVEEGETDEYVTGTLTKLGEEFNAELDKVFGTPVSRAAFCGVNPLSPTPSGAFLYEALFDALLPFIKESVEEFEKSRSKYTEPSKARAAKRATGAR